MRRREVSSRAQALRALLVFTALQGFLLTVNLHLLPMWGGEAGTLNRVALPAGGILHPAHTDLQPPLYFLLAQAWLKLTGGKDPLFALRWLSALCAIAATILFDVMWVRKGSPELREWTLQLWAFSPCLLLFGRMANSGSLQVLLTIAAVWALLRFADEPTSWKRMAILAASLTALLYTNYLPGIALWGGSIVLLWLRARADDRPLWRMFLPNALAVAAFMPWIAVVAGSLPRWGQLLAGPNQLYNLTGNGWIEAAVKLGCGIYSLAFGEAFPLWLLVFSALLALPYLWMLALGARLNRPWLLPAATVALLGYIGAAHSVSYPFMGGSLLFLLPLCMVAVSAGIAESGRVGTVFGIALFAANAGGVWSYFEARDILNLAYVAPNQRVVASIILRSSPADTMVWVDGLTVDDRVFQYYLPLNFSVRVLRSAADADAAWSELQGNAGIRHLWFLRNPNDLSTGRAFEKLEQRTMGLFYAHMFHPYVLAPVAYRDMLKYVMHVKQPAGYAYGAWEFRR